MGVPRCLRICMPHIHAQMWDFPIKMRCSVHIWGALHTLSKNHRSIQSTNNSRISQPREPSRCVSNALEKPVNRSACCVFKGPRNTVHATICDALKVMKLTLLISLPYIYILQRKNRPRMTRIRQIFTDFFGSL